MAETPLEQTAKAVPSEEKKEEKQEKKEKTISTLESVVNETSRAFGNVLKLSLAAGIPFTQATLVPPLARDTAILAGAQIAADATTSRKRNEKYTMGDVAKSSAVGTGIAALATPAYALVNKISLDSLAGYVGRAAAFGGIVYPLYIGAYQFLDYTIKNMTFKGLGKYLKENYWSQLKNAWKYVFPFGLANVLLAPLWLQIPIGAALSYIVALFAAPKKGEVPEEKKRDKTPYLVAASSAAYKLGRILFYSPLKAVEAIGGAIKDLYKKAPAKTPATAAQQA